MFAQHPGKGRLHRLALAQMEDGESAADRKKSHAVCQPPGYVSHLSDSKSIFLKKHIINQCGSYRTEEGENKQGRADLRYFYLGLGGMSTQPLGPPAHTFLSGVLVMCPAYGWS